MTTGYERSFYRDVEVIRSDLHHMLPDIRDALLLQALKGYESDEINELHNQLLDGILVRHGVRRVES